MPLRVVALVEGQGEEGAIRKLLECIWYDFLKGDYIEVIPWRAKRGQLLLADGKGLRPVIKAVAKKLHATVRRDFRRLILILLDTEGHAENCPKTRAQEIEKWAREERGDAETEIACVLPNVMFETWFAAAAQSLRGENGLSQDLPKPDDPEGDKLGKNWLRDHLSRKYTETIDQPGFVARMDLTECRNYSRSFRKLIKELEIRLQPPSIT